MLRSFKRVRSSDNDESRRKVYRYHFQSDSDSDSDSNTQSDKMLVRTSRKTILINLSSTTPSSTSTKEWENIFLLPDIFSDNIQLYLSDNDAIQMLHTNSLFYRLYIKHPRILHHCINISDYGILHTKRLFHGPQSCFHLRNINREYGNDNLLVNKYYDYGMFPTTNSVKLNLVLTSSLAISNFIPTIPSVGHLIINEYPSKVYMLKTQDNMSILMKYLDSLHTLLLNMCFSKTLVYQLFLAPTWFLEEKTFPLLTNLHITVVSICDLQFWKQMMPTFPRLDTLGITGAHYKIHQRSNRWKASMCSEYTQFLHQSLFLRSCSSIRVLSFSAIPLFASSNMLVILGAYAALHCEELSFTMCLFQLDNENDTLEQNLFLPTYTRLTKLVMRQCQFSNNCFAMDISSKFPVLTHLDLSNNELSNSELLEFFMDVRENSALQYLNLESNFMNSDTFTILINALDYFPKIQQISVGNNQIGLQGINNYLSLLNTFYSVVLVDRVQIRTGLNEGIISSLQNYNNTRHLKQLLSIHLISTNNEHEDVFLLDEEVKIIGLITSVRVLIKLFLEKESVQDIHLEENDSDRFRNTCLSNLHYVENFISTTP